VFNISATGKINNVLVGGLILTSLIYIVIGLFHFNPGNLVPFFTQGNKGLSGMFISIPIAMVAFGSIVAAAFMVSDIKEPKKTIPKSMFISMGIIILIYLLIILTTLGLITTEFLINNPGMQFIPLFAASWSLSANYSFLPYIISFAAVLALITTMLVLVALCARTISTLSENGLLPKIFGNINKKTKTPINATILVTLICIIVSCFPKFVEGELINAAALFAAITIIINIITLIIAHKKNTYVEGNFRVPGGKILPIILIFIIGISYIPSIISGLPFWYLTIGWYVIGLIIFGIMTKVFNKQKT
jgi:amino acid transporter